MNMNDDTKHLLEAEGLAGKYQTASAEAKDLAEHIIKAEEEFVQALEKFM